MEKKIRSFDNAGFSMAFENGLRVSIAWGPANYCDNHSSEAMTQVVMASMFGGASPAAESDNAEAAVYDGEKMIPALQFIDPDGDTGTDEVAGWLTPEQIVDLLAAVRSAKPGSWKKSL